MKKVEEASEDGIEDLDINPPVDEPSLENNEPEVEEIELAEAELEEEQEEDYSKKVRKRIAREERLKAKAREEAKQAKEEADFWKGRAEEMARKLAKATEISPASLEEKERRLIELRDQLTPDETREEEEKIILEIHNLKNRKTVDVPGVGKLPEDVKWEEPAKPQVAAGPPPEAYADWLGKNKWYTKPEYKAKSAIAEEADREMREEGWDPRVDTGQDGEDDFFAELDARIADSITKISGKKHVVMTGAAPKPSDTRTKKVTLSQDDFQRMRETMEKVGLDPNNKANVKAYLQEYKRLETRTND
jgi:hypothetical protein